MNQAQLFCCSRITLHGRNGVESINLIISNGRQLIVGFDFSLNILLITSFILHILLNPYIYRRTSQSLQTFAVPKVYFKLR